MRCMEWLDDEVILNQALPNIRSVLERHYNDVKMSMTVLTLFETLITKLEKQHLVTHVVPSMLIMKLNEPTVMERFIGKYLPISVTTFHHSYMELFLCLPSWPG